MLRLASDSVIDPKTSKLQWDAKLGLTAPLWNTPTLKMDAIGEVFVPLPSERPALLPTSLARRLGLGLTF